jgi:hypothetical protein
MEARIMIITRDDVDRASRLLIDRCINLIQVNIRAQRIGWIAFNPEDKNKIPYFEINLAMIEDTQNSIIKVRDLMVKIKGIQNKKSAKKKRDDEDRFEKYSKQKDRHQNERIESKRLKRNQYQREYYRRRRALKNLIKAERIKSEETL